MPAKLKEARVDKLTFLALLSLVACGDHTTDDTSGNVGDGGGSGQTGASIEDYINVTVPPSGAIFNGDANGCFDGETWLEDEQTANLDANKLGWEVSMTGTVVDQQTGDEIDDANVHLWFDNYPIGTPDVEETTNAAGTFGSPFPSCQPVAYKVFSEAKSGGVKETYAVNKVEAWAETKKNVSFPAWSSTSYAKVPQLLGFSPDFDKGVATGQVLDCRSKPVTGAQVVAVSPDNYIPESLGTYYYIDGRVSRNQLWTSADGNYLAVNIPPGDWRLQAWVADGAGGFIMIGQSLAPITANAVNVVNIFTAYKEGIVYPANCRSDF